MCFRTDVLLPRTMVKHCLSFCDRCQDFALCLKVFTLDIFVLKWYCIGYPSLLRFILAFVELLSGCLFVWDPVISELLERWQYMVSVETSLVLTAERALAVW